MKKITLALTVLLSLGLSACSSQSQKDESAYKGQVIFTEFQGDDVKINRSVKTTAHTNKKVKQKLSFTNTIQL